MNIQDIPLLYLVLIFIFIYRYYVVCRNPIFNCEQTSFLNRLVIIWCQTGSCDLNITTSSNGSQFILDNNIH